MQEKQKMDKKIKILETMIRKIVKEERTNYKNLNIEQPVSNLYIKGWGLDVNGNFRIIVGFPNDRGFSIQTNGTLPDTQNILRRKNDTNFTSDELEKIGEEVTRYSIDYLKSRVKNRLRIRSHYQGWFQ